MSADDGRSPFSGSDETDGDGGGGSDGEDDPATITRPEAGERQDTDGRRTGPGPGRGDGPRELLRQVASAKGGPLLVVREVSVSVVTVALIGLLLFGLSGVWPPMVAVESGSMEPHMHRGDLVFVSEPGRYVPDDGERGVVTRTEGARLDYRTFGGYGSVVVYDSPKRGGPPVIHRAHFWVSEGENWYDEADPAYHDADGCDELPNCPAPHAGFITKGDANGGYDQAIGISSPVRPGWVIGVAQVRVPYLGYVRLWLAEGSEAPLVASTPGLTPAPERTPGQVNAGGAVGVAAAGAEERDPGRGL